MSRSHRTAKRRVAAERRLARDDGGELLLPRIVARRPARETAAGVRVVWPGREVLAMWFFIEVLAHELGHHYRNQYRIRRGSAKGRRHEEFVAELHSARFYDAMVRRIRGRS